MRQISIRQLKYIFGFLALSLSYVFREKAVDVYTGRECTSALDITAILDSSTSIEKNNWDKHVIPSLHLLGDKFKLAHNQTRIGITTFATNSIVHTSLNSIEATSNNGFKIALKRIEKSYYGGNTNPLQAFLDIETNQLRLHSSRAGVPYVISFFTDGDITSQQDQEKILKSVARIKQNKDVHLVCFAIGSNIKTNYLTNLCESDNIYKVGYFSNLADAISAMAKRICTIPTSDKPKQDNCMCAITQHGCYLFFPAGMLFGAALTALFNKRISDIDLNQRAIAERPILSFSQKLQQSKRRVVDAVADMSNSVPAALDRNQRWFLGTVEKKEENTNMAYAALERNINWCRERINQLPDRATLYQGIKQKLHLA